MSWSVEIFISGAPSLKALASELMLVLGLDMQLVQDDQGEVYEGSGRDFSLRLYGEHGMSNDRDMNFEDYPYQMSLWLLATPDREQARTDTLNFASAAFGKLKETGRYALMLVEDTQKKLAAFRPGEGLF